MKSHETWQKLLSVLSNRKTDIQTTPMNSRKPLWFSAEVVKDKIVIDNAVEKFPSCNLKSPRVLSWKKFQEVFPYYIRRNEGEEVSKEVTSITRHQVYYYGLIRQAMSDPSS
jgi:hypothetical protein